MKKLFSKLSGKTLLKFIIVGVFNTLFGTAVMFVFYNIFHLGYVVSSASNYFFGSILSYFLNRNFTFQSKANNISSIWKFAVNIILCYVIAYGAAQPLIHTFLHNCSESTRDNLSMLLGAGIFIIINYLGQRLFVFNSE